MPVKLIGEQCAFPRCCRPIHGATLCWSHYQGARPFDENDPVSVELAVERLIDRLAPPPPVLSNDVWPVLSDFYADRQADLAQDARRSETAELEDGDL